jgi:hypothetical protein
MSMSPAYGLVRQACVRRNPSVIQELSGIAIALLPAALPEEFLTSDLASALERPRHLAQKVAYCLRSCGLIEPVGRNGNAIVYSRARAALRE